MSDNKHIIEVAQHFLTEGMIDFVEPYGDGHINSTYVATSDKKRYILQKMNTSLFTEPEKLMRNIRLVTDYLKKAVEEAGVDESVLEIIKTDDGRDLYENDGEAWRMYAFIEESICYQQVESTKDFYECAEAFGKFATYLDEFDASVLYEAIPNFHNTTNRLKNLEAAISADVCGRVERVSREIEFYRTRKSYCTKITSLLDSGEMPNRVTHNDTKLNNILFSRETGNPLAIIDLDTVMPGSVCYDFGDSIRYGCNTVAEDEPDASKVDFSVELFEAFTKGYIKGFDKITKIERDNLLWGAMIITYECGMRFLTDYISGDTYFHTTRADQNLDRAHTQMRMVELMEEKFDELERIVREA